MAVDLMRFPDGSQARVLHVPREAAAEEIVEALGIPRPRALLVLNGGTAELEAELKAQLGALLQDGLARIAAEAQITLVTGATDAGIFALLGQGLSKWEPTAPCIGVAVAGLVQWPGHPEGDVPLEPHHSHFVLVDGENWGDETATMYRLIAALSQDCPSAAVFAGGGEIAVREMQANVSQGREMILIAGSGRKVDALLGVPEGQQTDDSRLVEIAQNGKLIPFDIQQGPEALRDLVRRVLFGNADTGR